MKRLSFSYVFSLGALRTLCNLKLNGLAFCQRFETLVLDFRIVNKDVFSVLLFDEPKTLVVVEPFHLACCHYFLPS